MTDWAGILQKANANPDVVVIDNHDSEASAAAKLLATEERRASAGTLKVLFEAAWEHLDGPALTAEYKFHPDRRWRADYCHEATRTIVELEGGVWTGGRHTRGRGYIDDTRKYNAATSLGYSVYRLPTGEITIANVQMIIDTIEASHA